VPLVTQLAAPPVGLVPLRSRLLLAVLVSLVFVGCPCLREPVNASPSIRWWLFSNFGANRLCPEMLSRSAPLRLAPNPNVVGRLYPEQCQAVVNDQAQTITLSFSGSGLVWTPVAGRVAFTAAASVEYKMDFYLAEDAVYVWARPARVVSPPVFQVTAVEAKLLDMAAQGPLGFIANALGGQIVSGQLASGFTVVHAEDGDSFALGQLQPPARPPRVFAGTEGRKMLVNETIEVHHDQIDLLGPLLVEEPGQALHVRLVARGPGLDVLLLPRGTGDLMRQSLAMGNPLGPPPSPPMSSFPLMAGRDFAQRIPLAPGQYYLLLDNSMRIGVTNPPWNPLGVVGSNTGLVSAAVELGKDE
jgi:hypothetical protein